MKPDRTPSVGLRVAVIVVAIAAAAIIIDLCTTGEPQTFGLHPDARGPAARRKFIVAALASEVYYYNWTPEAKAIPDGALIGYDTIKAAEADGLKPSAEAAEDTTEIDRIEIKMALMHELMDAWGDGFAALCELQESHRIFVFTEPPDFALRADGVVFGVWPMQLWALVSDERVNIKPMWTRPVADGGIWRPANAAAEAIDSGRLAADLAATRSLAAARPLAQSEIVWP